MKALSLSDGDRVHFLDHFFVDAVNVESTFGHEPLLTILPVVALIVFGVSQRLHFESLISAYGLWVSQRIKVCLHSGCIELGPVDEPLLAGNSFVLTILMVTQCDDLGCTVSRDVDQFVD